MASAVGEFLEGEARDGDDVVDRRLKGRGRERRP